MPMPFELTTFYRYSLEVSLGQEVIKHNLQTWLEVFGVVLAVGSAVDTSSLR